MPIQADKHEVTTTRSEQIRRRPWTSVAGCPGVYVKELSRRHDLVDVLLRFEPGASTPGRPHMGIEQHIWVLEGEVSVGSHRLSDGAYIVVPPGAAHPIAAAGAKGCLLLQSHIPVTAAPLTEVVSTSCQQ
ncbi:cupin domain-containing protein [Hamadaea sp. NPDC050747]|uniref:cupin domain-containing protein n=1 Tax=Hamadaea sp. NPDC050747 TaxID=3155789 RepID=UPI0033F645DE